MQASPHPLAGFVYLTYLLVSAEKVDDNDQLRELCKEATVMSMEVLYDDDMPYTPWEHCGLQFEEEELRFRLTLQGLLKNLGINMETLVEEAVSSCTY